MIRHKAENRTVKIRNTEMEYAVFGNGPIPAVILPGLSDGLTTVKGKAAVLSIPYRPFLNEFTVYMFSRANDLPKGHSISNMAEDQALAMIEAGIPSACVLGVSQGGMIAEMLAASHPELVRALCLTVTSACANDVIDERISCWIDCAEHNDYGTLLRDTAEHCYSPSYLRKVRAVYPLLERIGKPKTFDRFLVNAKSILAFDASSVLASIHCPTLIIGGAKDQIVGTGAAHLLHKAIPQSELYVYPELGHGLYEEAKDFYPRVFDFFRTACAKKES